MDVKKVIEQFQDYLAPKLDTYEQAIYLYIFRHSRLVGKEEVVIGFKSARKKMAFGVGEKGKAMSEGTCYEKIKSLQSKGCLKILDSTSSGTKLDLKLPEEIDGIIPLTVESAPLDLASMDFFSETKNRLAIFNREGEKCFYCFRKLDKANFVVEHVESRPKGDNSYRNLVASCRSCNNRKGDISAIEFLRTLTRENHLSDEEFEGRLKALRRLKNGELVPQID